MDDQSQKRAFGQRLRRFREAQGMTMREFSNAVSLSYSYVRSLEAGIKNPPSSDALARMSRVLRVSVDALLGKDDVGAERGARIERALELLEGEVERSRDPRVLRFLDTLAVTTDEDWQAIDRELTRVRRLHGLDGA